MLSLIQRMGPELSLPARRATAITGEGHRLLIELEAAANDPHGTLIAMQSALGVDIGLRLGFEAGLVENDPSVVRSKPLTPDQFEAIKSFEEIIETFCRYGVLEPHDFGDWLSMPNRRLHYKTPVDVLFEKFTAEGFNKPDLDRVLEVGEAFFGLSYGGGAAIQELLNR